MDEKFEAAVEAAKEIALGVPTWAADLAFPIAFGLIAFRLVWKSSPAMIGRALADSVRAIADAAAPGSRDASAADERAAPAERTDELAPVAQRVFARLSRGERLLERTGLRRQ